MANWDLLKASIANVIRTNGNQEITGDLLQGVLNNIVSSVGQNATFGGIATPSINPGAPDGPVFYLATSSGVYSNFGGISLTVGEAAILLWKNGYWLKQTVGFITQEGLKKATDEVFVNLGKFGSWSVFKTKLDGLITTGRYIGVYDAGTGYVHNFVLLVGQAGSGVYTQALYGDFSAENMNGGVMGATGGAKVIGRVYSGGAWSAWESDAENNAEALEKISVDLGTFTSVEELMVALDELPGKSIGLAKSQRYHGVLKLENGMHSSPFTVYQGFFNAGMYVFQDLDTNYMLETLTGGSAGMQQRNNYYRRGTLSVGTGYKWDAWATETSDIETKIESLESADANIEEEIEALKTSDENTAIALQQNVVKQFTLTTKQRLYRRIEITHPKGWTADEGYAAWVHTRMQHYLLSSSSALFGAIEGQLFEVGTAYNDLAVGNGDIHVKMVITGKNNLVRLYVAVEAYNYVQVETVGDVKVVASSESEFNSITPSVVCRSLDIQEVIESLSSLSDDVNAMSEGVSNLEDEIANTKRSLAGLISGVSDTVDNNYAELTDLSKTVDDNYAELDDRVFNNKNAIEEAGVKIAENSAAIKNVQDSLKLYIHSDIDLSHIDIYGNNISRSTANCYVINKAGYYCFPLFYGSSWYKGMSRKASYTNINGANTCDFVNYKDEVITDYKITGANDAVISIADCSCIQDIRVVKKYRENIDYCIFTVRSMPIDDAGGNVVVSIRDENGLIMWSWHIWLYPHDLTPIAITNSTGVEYNILPVNLGHSRYNNALLYQWGRNIPFLGGTGTSQNTNTNLGDNAYKVVTESTTIGEALMNPNTFYCNSDNVWLDGACYNLWDASLDADGRSDNAPVKTIYDPCPVGFKVPNGRLFTGCNSGTVLGNWSYGWKFKKNSEDTEGFSLPAGGYINTEGVLVENGKYGKYWTNAVYSQNARYHLSIHSNKLNITDVSSEGYIAQAFNIRPVAY